MNTMRSMNPDAPNFINATNAASVYGDFISKPKYAETEKFLQIHLSPLCIWTG